MSKKPLEKKKVTPSPSASRNPSFFKVMLDNSKTSLRIPPAFAKRYGEIFLGESTVTLRRSGRGAWAIQLNKKIKTDLLFEKGWSSFVEDNNLDNGDFLVFTYNSGDKKFDVMVYDRMGCEKGISSSSDVVDAYPKSLEPNSGGVRNEATKGVQSERKTGQIGVISASKTRKQNILHGDPIRANLKRSCTLYEEDTEENSMEILGESGRKTKGGATNAIVRIKEEDELDASATEDDNSEASTPSSKEEERTDAATNGKAPRLVYKTRMHPTESVRAAAQKFKSTNPFCVVYLRESYVEKGFVYLPFHFVKQYLTKKLEDEIVDKDSKNVTLRVEDGRTWHVRLTHKNRKAYICNEWREFVLQNDLGAGDACVFELIKSRGIVLKVSCFRSR